MDLALLPHEILSMVIDFAITKCFQEARTPYHGEEDACELITNLLLVNRRWNRQLSSLRLFHCSPKVQRFWEQNIRVEPSLERYVRSYTDLSTKEFSEGAKQTLVTATEMYLSAIFKTISKQEKMSRFGMTRQLDFLRHGILAMTGICPTLSLSVLGADIKENKPVRVFNDVRLLDVLEGPERDELACGYSGSDESCAMEAEEGGAAKD